MAVVEMKRIHVYALKSNRKKILEMLQRRGAVEVNSPDTAGELFSKTDTASARQTFEKNAQLMANAVSILDGYAPPEKGMLSMLEGRKAISARQYEETAEAAPALVKTAGRIVALGKKIADEEAEVLRLEAQIDALQPWMGLDIPMRQKGTGSTAVFIGTFPDEMTEAGLKERLAQALPQVSAIEAEVVSSQAQQTCAFVVCHSKYAAEVEGALRGIGFTYPAAPSKTAPAQRVEELKGRIAAAHKEAKKAEDEIRSYASQREGLLFTADYFTMRGDKYQVLGNLWQSPHVFYLTGYAPAKIAPALQKQLEESYHAFVELEDPDPAEDLPVRLENGFFAGHLWL